MHPLGYMPFDSARDPVMKKSSGMLTRLGGGRLIEFGKDYAYVGVDFRGDLYMVLPEGEDFDDDLGDFLVFEYILFFCYF
jgi:hypothetical protein